jgi:hypothetical protein
MFNGSDIDGQSLEFFYMIDPLSARPQPRPQIWAEFRVVRKPLQYSPLIHPIMRRKGPSGRPTISFAYDDPCDACNTG